ESSRKFTFAHCEFENTPEDSPEPKAHGVVPGYSETPGEESSASECFSCVSSPGELHAAEDGTPQLPPDTASTGHREMTQPQVVGEWEASSLIAQDSFPPHLGMSHIGQRVQVKRGVAVSWDRAEVLEPPSKKTRGEEFALPKGVPKTSSPLCAQEHLPDSLSGLESKAPQDVEEEGKEADVEEEQEEEEEEEETRWSWSWSWIKRLLRR
ncbi:hypothetical protein MUG91_G692n1, partial [Manis pentadactyla]